VRSSLLLRSIGVAALSALAFTAVYHGALPVGASSGVPAASAGINKANFDPTCKACDDFYQFVNGGWIASHEIPAKYGAYGSLTAMSERNRDVLHETLEAAAKNTTAAAGTNEQKIGSFYRSCMNETAIEAAGITPLQPELAKIDAIADVNALVVESAHLRTIGVGTLFNSGSTQDDKDSSKQIAEVSQGGLSLNRDYYTGDDDKTKDIRAKYVTYITTQFTNLGDDPAKAATEAQSVLTTETGIAQYTLRRVELRDPALSYHPMPLADVQALAPAIDFKAYFAAENAPAFVSLNNAHPNFIKGLNAQLASESLADWKTYMRFKLVDSYTGSLPKKFGDANFAFRGVELGGAKEQPPRWERCVAATDRVLGEALGQAYVARNFSPTAKAKALALVNNLQSTLAADIKTLPWMSSPTQAYAEKKLTAFTKKIGYPNTWKSYAKLTITDAPYATNAMAASTFFWNDDVARIGKPVDRAEWGMTPPTVNAYYNPANNEIVFPAGILQTPFFSEKNDDALNYGAAGAVIGHEMTHGFDDQGRQYDATGNRIEWWTAADTKNFDARKDCIVNEYDAFGTAPDAHEDGKLVTGEAIADLGGLTIAYKAFQKTAEYTSHKTIDGYTPEQRFFIAFATVWQQKATDKAERSQMKTNEHPLSKFRVIGTLENMPEFAAAFKCAATDKMVKKDRCQIW